MMKHFSCIFRLRQWWDRNYWKKGFLRLRKLFCEINFPKDRKYYLKMTNFIILEILTPIMTPQCTRSVLVFYDFS